MKSRLFSVMFLFIGLTNIFFSCTAPIEINTRDAEPVIVIYGCLTDEIKYQSVRVTRSSPYFDNKENDVVSDAKVQIVDSDGNEYVMKYKEKGIYLSEDKFAVRPNITYNLTVNVDFDKDGVNEVYEANTTILPVIKMDSIKIKPLNIMGYRHYSLNLFGQDPVKTKDFYLFKFFINDTISNDQISKLIVSSDDFFNGSYMRGVNIYYLEDATDEDVIEKNKDNDDIYMVYPGDSVRLQALNIEEKYFNFINECYQEMQGENPMFGSPPSNITTNISNGAVGFFTGYCIQELKTVVP